MQSKKYIYVGGITNENKINITVGAEYNIIRNEFNKPCITNQSYIIYVLNDAILNNCFKEVVG